MRNLIISAALVAASLFGMTAQAAEAPAAPYVELTNPVPVAVPGKIEVTTTTSTVSRMATREGRGKL